jgi:lysophospholipase L1-like esterase
MKHVLRSVLLFAIIIIITSVSMITQKKTRILFFGDSITEMGVNPGGFITLIGDELKAKGLSSQYDIIGGGVGGDRVYDLYLRMDEDVLAKAPDVVVIWVGVNDVWHKTSGTGTSADKFEKFYVAIIKKLLAKNIKVILAPPAVIGERTDVTNPQDGDLNYYSNIVSKIAKEYKTDFIDLRKDFIAFDLKNNPENKESGILTIDGVHLAAAGNKLVAQKMLEVLVPGYKWN